MRIEGSIDSFLQMIREDVCEGCLLYFCNHGELLDDADFYLVYKLTRYLFISYRFPHFSIYKIKEEFEKSIKTLHKNYGEKDEEIYKPVIYSLVSIFQHHSIKNSFFDPLDQIL